MHLLKWQLQARKRGKSWRATIAEQRRRLRGLLAESPSLRALLDEFVTNTYPDAVQAAAIETGLSTQTFPSQCPWRAAQIMDEEFWPEQ